MWLKLLKKETFLVYILPCFLLISLYYSIFFVFNTHHYIPKPIGYPRIVLPSQTYQGIPCHLPYFFEISSHATFQEEKIPTKRYWANIIYPQFNAEIEITYKPLKKNTSLLKEYINDSYKITHKHQVKSYRIEDSIIQTKQGKTAFISELTGEVPTQLQFYITDSTEHFLRGALYFNTALHNDSLEPVIDFIKLDIIHMLNTLTWKKKSKTTYEQLSNKACVKNR